IFFIKNINTDFIDNFLFTLNNCIIFSIIIYLIFFNFNIHKKFQNYISLFFSLFGIIFLLNFILYKNFALLGGNLINLELILNFSISYFIIIFTYIYNQEYIFDYFFLHIFAYFINILAIIYYLIFGNFELFNIGVILLLDSFLIFLSYFKLKSINK
ncbi:MAG: hypothetical protein Q9M94_00630, partial [Candidatus Gracilibacteria bacterium]|nr:hypothetical protein [Candidatus Gracilibacteria bacterium]